MFNESALIGRLGREPETAYTPNKTKVVKLRVATTRKWKDRETGDMKEKTNWIPVEVMGSAADRAEQYHTGDLVFVKGSIEVDTWKDKDTGQGRSRFCVKTFTVFMMRPKVQGQDTSRSDRSRPAPDQKGFEDDIQVPESDFDDVPF